MNLWWEHLPFKWSSQVNCSSLIVLKVKGGHSNLQSPSFSGISITSLNIVMNFVFSPHANPNGKNEIFMLAVLVSTVVYLSHLVTRNGRPIGQIEIRVRSWHCQALERYCLLTTNYLISSQTWARFISILWVWWTSDSFMALRIDMNFVFKIIIIVLKNTVRITQIDWVLF